MNAKKIELTRQWIPVSFEPLTDVERAALEEGVSPEEILDGLYQITGDCDPNP